MTQTTSTEFRKHTKAYFDSVEKGETVQVLRHGKVIAEVNPPREDSGKPSWKRPGLRLVIPGASFTQAILDARRESQR